jgi:putative membrane protein insertion efficiency factor
MKTRPSTAVPWWAQILRWPGLALTGLLIGLVKFYRLFFRHWVGPVCRYEPSCSTYALQALQQHGGWLGGQLGARRLLRCNPWCLGGHDPVPDQLPPGLFSGLLAAPQTQDTPSTRIPS